MLLLTALASAYETDQLTERHVPLADAREVANAELNRLLLEAVAATNAETGCRGDADAVRPVLARHIWQLTSPDAFVEGRGEFAGMGYGRYSAFLETAPIERHTFLDRRDIYGEVGLGGSLILDGVGPCSTIRLAGVLMGTDKPDHFLGEGYAYALRSRFGAREARAVRWGTFTELSYYGLLTSRVFSFADLRANYDGYTFYRDLLREGSEVQLGPDGCATLARPFDWGDYVDAEYDEVLNPPVYPLRVKRSVTVHLRNHREAYCASYLAWGHGYSTRLYAALAEPVPYATDKAPARQDPFRLDWLCYGLPRPDPGVPLGDGVIAEDAAEAPTPGAVGAGH